MRRTKVEQPRSGEGAGERLHRFLADEVIAGAGYSAATAAVSRGGSRVASASAGFQDPGTGEEARVGDLFDLASLTKLWVATLAAVLHDDGSLPLETRVGDVWPSAPAQVAPRSCDELLRHRAGLQPWAPFYLLCRDGREPLDVLGDPRFAGAPPGTYSDLGYILFRILAEHALASPLPALVTARLGPLASELETAPTGARVVWCGLGTAKEVELARALGFEAPDLGSPERGQAQDGNARFLGGLAGHAGLFGTVGALVQLGEAWLHPAATPSAAAVERALANGSGSFALGWWRVQPGGGTVLSPAAFGHPGFAGGSLWVDPRSDIVVAMLGHRRDPFGDLAPLRGKLHRLALEIAGNVRGLGGGSRSDGRRQRARPRSPRHR